MKEYRWFIQKEKGSKLYGQICITEEEAKQILPIYLSKGYPNAFIKKRKVEIPKPLTEKEKLEMEETSKLLKRLQGLM